MPPKAAARIQDWSWVGSVASVDGITPQLRRQAAGFSGPATQRVCAYKFDNLKRAQTVESDEGNVSEASVVILKDQKEKDRVCQARRCRTNPRCYNHLGGSEVGPRDIAEADNSGSRMGAASSWTSTLATRSACARVLRD